MGVTMCLAATIHGMCVTMMAPSSAVSFKASKRARMLFRPTLLLRKLLNFSSVVVFCAWPSASVTPAFTVASSSRMAASA